MEHVTKHVNDQFNVQESTAAHACVLAANSQASIDGRGRALVYLYVEHLSRSVKSKNISLNQYDLSHLLQTDLTPDFEFYSLEKYGEPVARIGVFPLCPVDNRLVDKNHYNPQSWHVEPVQIVA